MRMKPSSANHKTISRARARNATLINLFATPGLGSLICRRWLEGIGQLLLALAGCGLILVWFFREMFSLYSTADFSEAPVSSPGWKILIVGVILLAVSWIWSAFTSISLFKGATDEKTEAIKNFAAPPLPKLDAAQIAAALASVPDWQQNGAVISRTFQFRDFPAAIKFVNAAAAIAEHEWHHPDIDIRWNKVALALTTHDAGGLTAKDFMLAKKFDDAAVSGNPKI